MCFPKYMNISRTHSTPPRPSDVAVKALLAKMTRGTSPASVIGAYMDWATHIAASPGNQRELIESAMREWSGWWRYVQSSVEGECTPCVHAKPIDKRFKHEAWKKIPFNWVSQAFLINQRLWSDAMTGVRGVSQHHEEVAEFTTRQWLDIWSPSNAVVTNPEILSQTFASGGLNLIRGANNWLQDISDFVAQRKLPGSDAFVPGKTVAVTPGSVIFRNRLIELIQYEAKTSTAFPEPVLIVPSWIMKYYILDLSQHNSLVKYLVDAGHTVFIVSWKNPTAEDRDLSLEDYVRLGAIAAIDAVRKVCPSKKIHAAGYCLGGTLLAMASALLARNHADHSRDREFDKRSKRNVRIDDPFASLTMLASQIDFHEPGELSLFIDESQIAYLEDIMWEQGYLDGKQMAGAFALINSNDLIWSRMIHSYLMGTRSTVTDLKAWNADATRMPYQMHSEYLRSLYMKNDLAEGRFELDGKPIFLRDVHVPIFVVSTELDHVSPWRSVYKIHLLTEGEVTFVLSSGGHNVGVVNPPSSNKKTVEWKPQISFRVGTRLAGAGYTDPEAWQAQARQHSGSWWPTWQQWLAERSGKPIRPTPIGGLGLSRLAVIEPAPGKYVHGD
jgi:polyhydroxyalkanoate synthase subunit PhaC